MAERKRRFYGGEEAAMIGRALAALKNSDPETFEAIMEFAQRNGMGPAQAIAYLSKRAILLYQVEEANLSLKDLYIAWNVFMDFMNLAMKTYATAMNMFLNESSQAIGQIIQERVNEALKSVEASKKPKAEQLKEKLIDMFVDLMEPMMKASMKSMFKAMGMDIPDKLKVKIPVEVKEVGSGEGGA